MANKEQFNALKIHKRPRRVSLSVNDLSQIKNRLKMQDSGKSLLSKYSVASRKI